MMWSSIVSWGQPLLAIETRLAERVNGEAPCEGRSGGAMHALNAYRWKKGIRIVKTTGGWGQARVWRYNQSLCGDGCLVCVSCGHADMRLRRLCHFLIAIRSYSSESSVSLPFQTTFPHISYRLARLNGYQLDGISS